MVSERLLYRPEEAAAVLGCSRALVYQLVSSGKLPHVRISTSIRIPRSELENWIQRQLDERAVLAGQ